MEVAVRLLDVVGIKTECAEDGKQAFEMFEKSNIKKKVTKELLDKHFNEIENSMTAEACEYLEESIRALQYLKKYI